MPKSARFLRNVVPVIAIVVMAVAANVGCTIHPTDVPSPTGPSTLATSVSIGASPTVVNRDGASSSTITVTVVDDAHGSAPLPNVELRVDFAVRCGAADPSHLNLCPSGQMITNNFGTVSATTIVTGRDGKAVVVYTAPPYSPTATEEIVSFLITPKIDPAGGFNAGAEVRTDIHVVPPGLIQPPPSGSIAPTARFTVTPSSPAALSPVQFDGSKSCPVQLDTSGNCPNTGDSIRAYLWDFGDGSVGSGTVTTHTFTNQQTFSVTLIVVNNFGISSAPFTLAVTVGAGSLPTADFVFSPSAPVASQPIQFNAITSRAGAGHTLVQYKWNFGDGGTASGDLQPTHSFNLAGAYNVTLTVVDESGQSATTVKPVAVGTGNPTASFTFSPTAPSPFTIVNFDASASTPAGGASIVLYQWSFGDGTATSSQNPTGTQHPYSSVGTYTVTLTVTDDASPARKGSTTQTITVK